MKKTVEKKNINKTSPLRKKVQKYKPQKQRLEFTNKKRIQKPVVNQGLSQNKIKLQNRKQPVSTLNNLSKKVVKQTKPLKRVIRATKQVEKKESLKKTRGQTQAHKETKNERPIFKTKQFKKRQPIIKKSRLRFKKTLKISSQNNESDEKSDSIQKIQEKKFEEEQIQEQKVQVIIQKEAKQNYQPNKPLKSSTKIENDQNQLIKEKIKEKRQQDRLELLKVKQKEKLKKQEIQKKKQQEKEAFLEEAKRNRGKPKIIPAQAIKRSKSQEKAIKKNQKNIKKSDLISQQDQNIKPYSSQFKDESQEKSLSQKAKISIEKQSYKSLENNQQVIQEKIVSEKSENSIKINQGVLNEENQIFQNILCDQMFIQEQINGLKSYTQSELKNAFQDNNISNYCLKEDFDQKIINEQEVIHIQNIKVDIQQEITKDCQIPVVFDSS